MIRRITDKLQQNIHLLEVRPSAGSEHRLLTA